MEFDRHSIYAAIWGVTSVGTLIVPVLEEAADRTGSQIFLFSTLYLGVGPIGEVRRSAAIVPMHG